MYLIKKAISFKLYCDTEENLTSCVENTPWKYQYYVSKLCYKIIIGDISMYWFIYQLGCTSHKPAYIMYMIEV